MSRAPITSSLIAVLDIGSSKIACLLARLPANGGAPHIIGIGHHGAFGIKNGHIVDLSAASEAVAAAIASAEQQAGESVERIIVNAPPLATQSQIIDASLNLAGKTVSTAEVKRLLQEGKMHGVAANAQMLHALPLGFVLDELKNIRDPRGMSGQDLSVQLHVLSCHDTALRTLAALFERLQLEVDAVVTTALASGLSCLVDDELELGATIIDLGAGSSSLGVFAGGHLWHSSAIKLGGQHITADIARGLVTPLAYAERLKTLYGSVYELSLSDPDLITVAQVGDDRASENQQVSKGQLNAIIRPRQEEILEMLRDKLHEAGSLAQLAPRIVLTGGASQMPGLRELATEILGRPVRLAKAVRCQGNSFASSGPAFAVASGLLAYAQKPPEDGAQLLESQHWLAQSWLGRAAAFVRSHI